jgi:hypothetical protein
MTDPATCPHEDTVPVDVRDHTTGGTTGRVSRRPMADPYPVVPEGEEKPLGWLFARATESVDLTAAEYRRLARVTAAEAFEEQHGPRADRKATVALAFSICALSAGEGYQ